MDVERLRRSPEFARAGCSDFAFRLRTVVFTRGISVPAATLFADCPYRPLLKEGVRPNDGCGISDERFEDGVRVSRPVGRTPGPMDFLGDREGAR